jgi:hypothetical protein
LTGLRVRRVGLPGLKRADRLLLGWQPTQPGLIADIDHPCYFKT